MQRWICLSIQGHPFLSKLWGLDRHWCWTAYAAVLWNGGISFGGVVAFLFADLIVLPILDIYRKYYGFKVSAFLLAIFYASMAASALVVEFLFGALNLIPHERKVQIVEETIRWNYTTILNIAFLILALILVIRFLHTGGPAMLRMMSRSGHRESMHDMGMHEGHKHHG